MNARSSPLVLVVIALLVTLACEHAPPASPTAAPRSNASAGPAAHGLRPPSTIDNILAAERAGKIDHDTALVWQVQGMFAPDRLPEALIGAPPDGPLEATAVISEIVRRLDRMTPALQRAIRPFLLRPTEPESFWNHQPLPPGEDDSPPTCSESYLDDPKYPIRYWYCSDDASAETQRRNIQSLQEHLDQASAYDVESRAMLGQTPCSDAGSNNGHDGGNGSIDVYIVPGGYAASSLRSRSYSLSGTTVGYTQPLYMDDKSCPTSAYIILNADANLDSRVAHELFHAIQLSFTPDAYRYWWSEASATWAEDLVFPAQNDEHQFLKASLWTFTAPACGPTGQCTPTTTRDTSQPTDGPLDTEGGPGGRTVDYGAYLWPFFLTRVAGKDPNTIGKVWKAMGANGNPLDAMKVAIPDFHSAFKQFALVNWNQDVPEAQKYVDYDNGYVGQPMSTSLIAQELVKTYPVSKSDPAKDSDTEVDLNVPHASVRYTGVAVEEGSPSQLYVPQLVFDLSGVANQANQDVSVQAIVRIAGASGVTSHYEDWGGATEKHYCRDKADEKVVGIVLIVANTGTDPAAAFSGKIKVKATGPCNPEPGGNFNYTAKVTIQHGGDPACVQQRQAQDKAMTTSSPGGATTRQQTTVTGDISYSENVTSQWLLTPVDDVTDPVKKLRTVMYEIDSGNRIELSGSGHYEDRKEVQSHIPAIPRLTPAQDGSVTRDARVSFSNQANGTSCNGPAPPQSSGKAPSWKCKPGWSPPAGRNGGRDGQAGSLTVRIPDKGQATYEIHWITADVDMQSTCEMDSSSSGSGGQSTSSTQHYDQGSNTMITTTNGKASTFQRTMKPGVYSGSAMKDPHAFWFGSFPSSGDIVVSDSRSSSDCANSGPYIGLEAAPCTFTTGQMCDACSYTASTSLHIHVDLPQAPLPSAAPPSLPAGSTPCTALAACCTSLQAQPAGAQAAAPCTMIVNLNNPSACSKTLSNFRGKNLCP
jgi:hypothetical protein